MIFAANFKTNHTRATTGKYIEVLKEKLLAKRTEDKVYIFPPATALDQYEGDFTIGTQNAYPTQNGAYTGEIGLEQQVRYLDPSNLQEFPELADILQWRVLKTQE